MNWQAQFEVVTDAVKQRPRLPKIAFFDADGNAINVGSAVDSDADLSAYARKDGAVFTDEVDVGTIRIGDDIGTFGSPAIIFDGVELFKFSPSELRCVQNLAASGSIFAQRQNTPETQMGAVGPSGQSGVLFGQGQDTNLYRAVAGVLKTSGELRVGGIIRFRDGDVTDRYGFIGEGVGPSAESGIKIAGDTNLYRASAGLLKSDGHLRLAGQLQAGEPVVARFASGGGSQVSLGYSSANVEGPGILFGNADDTNLYRSAAGYLRTDGAFQAQGQIVAGGNVVVDNINTGGKLIFGYLQDTNLYRASGSVLKTDGVFQAVLDIDAKRGASSQISIGAQGPASEAGIKFGSAGDANLYRVSAALLKTDGEFRAGSDIATYGAFRAMSAGAFQTTVGAAGGASALPATPTKYMKIKDDSGATFVVPAYAAS